jgi:hypothetical protein
MTKPLVFDPAAFRRLLDARGHGAKAGLAVAMGVSRWTIDNWAHGRGEPTGNQERQIAMFFGVEQRELLKEVQDASR